MKNGVPETALRWTGLTEAGILPDRDVTGADKNRDVRRRLVRARNNRASETTEDTGRDCAADGNYGRDREPAIPG